MPACGFSETVTFFGLPEPFAFANRVSQDFTIERSLDIAWLGTYEIKIKSEFEQPTIDGSRLPKMIKKEINFTLVINPCKVTKFTGTTSIA